MERESSSVQSFVISWNKQKIDAEYESGESFESLQAKIYSLTSVPPTKQKLIWKGKFIKTDEILEKVQFGSGCTIKLIGKADGKAKDFDNIDRKVFIEDLSLEQRAKYLKENFGAILPFGLVNLGNTCYINSCLQVLRKIPELKQRLLALKPDTSNPGAMLAYSLADVFQQLENSGDAVEPRNFIGVFMRNYPEFSERDQSGTFKQQDADECFQKLVRTIDPFVSTGKSAIDELFGFQLETTLKNTENEEEAAESMIEESNKFNCIIDNSGEPINLLTEGIEAGLSGQLEKHSQLENRNCIWQKTSRMITLPNYLVVQKVRFSWKQKDLGTANDAQRCKILKAVTFPKELEVGQFCTEELQKRIKQGQDILAANEETRIANEKKAFEDFKAEYIKEREGQEIDTLKITKAFRKQNAEKELERFDEELWKEHGTGVDTGNYRIIGVITHKGRGADSGHYVGWSQSKGNIWHRYDDDLVSQVKIEDIMALRGGGDWHTAYYLIYRKMEVDAPTETAQQE